MIKRVIKMVVWLLESGNGNIIHVKCEYVRSLEKNECAAVLGVNVISTSC